MALRLVYGNSGSGKSHYLYEKTVRMAAEDFHTNYFVVVPEQFTLRTQKELVERSPHGVIMNIDVVSFERLAYRVFDELGIRAVIMEETGKSLVLRRIAGEKADELTLLRGNIRRMGYIGELKSILSELMQYDVSAQDLRDLIGELPEKTNLRRKLSDILVMYEAFEDYLRGDYVTAEKVLEVLRDAADESRLLRDAVFVFDGFTGFTPVQMKFLHRLMHLAKDIYVAVTIDVRENAAEDKGIQDLFYMSRKMTRALLAAARTEGYEIGEPVLLAASGDSRFGSNPVLAHLEQNLFRPEAKRYEADCRDIVRISSLASPREELIFAAANIRRLMREQDLRYADFAVVSGNVEGYEKYAKQVFSMYGIPYFADMKKTILYHPLIELISAALEIVEKDYSYESVFRYLRTGLAGFCRDEVDELENYVVAQGIRGAQKWSHDFCRPIHRYGKVSEDDEQIRENLRPLNELRERLWEQTRPLYEIFRQPDSDVRGQTLCLYELLCGLQIEQQLRAGQEAFEERGEEILASEYRQIYKIVIDLLDKMVDLLGEERLTAEEYAGILEEGFSSARVGSVPPSSDCVILGDIERTRLEGVRVLFFLGVNDGLIPKSTSRSGILSQYDREILEKQEIELAPTAREQSFLQRFYLYLSMTKPSQALYLTCARMDGEGKAVRPSYLAGTLQELFEGLDIEEIEAGGMYGFSTPASGMETYLRGLLAAKRGIYLPEWKALHRWFSQNGESRRDAARLLEAAFDRYAGESLGEDTARLLYGTMLTNSVTRLEMFAQCAYAHFLKYGLKLSERDQYTIDSPDMGNLFHETLQRYCERLEREATWSSVTESQQETFLREAFAEAVSLLPNDFLSGTAQGTYVLERLYRILWRSVWAITEQIRHGSFLPGGYEVDFKQDYSIEKSGCRFRFVGRIDRMDIYETEDKVYVRIVDYKSGKKTFRLLNLFYGQQLQLVVYLKAALDKLAKRFPEKEILPAGIFYFHLDDPMAEETGEGEEAVKEEILEQMSLKGLVSLEPEVYQHMDAGLSGKSSVIPLTLKKDGTVSSRGTSGAGQENFASLTEFVDTSIQSAAEEMLQGEISVSPYELNGSTGCDYCPYHDICGFDEKIAGYSYRRKERMAEDKLWQKIRKKEVQRYGRSLDEGTTEGH